MRRPRDRGPIAQDILDMRARLLRAKPGRSVWDLKHAQGALTDISFLCSYFSIIGAGEHGRAPRAVLPCIEWLAQKGLLGQNRAKTLKDAQMIFDAILHVSRAMTGGLFDPAQDGETLCARMAALCGAQNIRHAEQILTQTQHHVSAVFHQTLSEALDGTA